MLRILEEFDAMRSACVDSGSERDIMNMLLPGACVRIPKGACHFSGRRIGKEVQILCGPAAVREERVAEYVTEPEGSGRPAACKDAQARIPAFWDGSAYGYERWPVVRQPGSPAKGEAGVQRRPDVWEASGYGVFLYPQFFAGKEKI